MHLFLHRSTEVSEHKYIHVTSILRSTDACGGAGGALPDFAPLLVQTTDRCFARRSAPADNALPAALTAEGAALTLHLWQNQPLPSWLRESMPPLCRVLSMCGAGRRAV